MNIFVTNKCPVLSAKFLDDKRVVNQIRESLQLLSTAAHLCGAKATPVKPTHFNHPCVKWVKESQGNFAWLLQHLVALCQEKHIRFPGNPPHVYEDKIADACGLINCIPPGILTPFVNCAENRSMGISFTHVQDVHKAYRLYLAERFKTDKKQPKWSNCDVQTTESLAGEAPKRSWL